MKIGELDINKILYMKNKLSIIESYQELVEVLIRNNDTDIDLIKKEIFRWTDEVCKWEGFFNETCSRKD